MAGSISTSKLILDAILVIWFLTLGRSIVIMIGGSKIFKKAHKGEKGAYIPILNLFTMLEIAEISTFFGILLFIPVCNVFVLIMMSYKLGTAFKTSFGYKMGLVFFPLMFYPLLGMNNKPYKLSDEEYFKALDNARGDSINLMTEEDIRKANEEVDPEDNVQIDSIFKSDIQLMEKVAPYKAAKIDLLGMNKLSGPGEKPEIDPALGSLNTVRNQTPPPATPEKKDDVETIDL